MSEASNAAVTWWDDAGVAALQREVARPTFRRSTLMWARRRFWDRKSTARRRGAPFPTTTFHDWWQVRQHSAWQDRANIAKWREKQRAEPIELTQEIVKELLNYDPETGVLTWRARDRRWFEAGLGWRALLRAISRMVRAI